jgi:regulator of sigma E protease
MTTSIFAFVIVLGVLIFFHELGHFLVARLFGVGVQTFSLGFGPRILGRKIGITDYRISAIPLGGFVKMVGEEPNAELTSEEIPLSFTHKHVLKKIFIVAAGPFFNLLLAVIIFYAIFQVSGLYIRQPSVGSVEPETLPIWPGFSQEIRLQPLTTFLWKAGMKWPRSFPKVRGIIFSLTSSETVKPFG